MLTSWNYCWPMRPHKIWPRRFKTVRQFEKKRRSYLTARPQETVS